MASNPPIQIPWHELQRLFTRRIEETFPIVVPRSSPAYEHNLAFARGRFDEGRQLADFLASPSPSESCTVLDIGSGNGGVALALANDHRYRVIAVDVIPNHDLVALRRSTGVRIHQVVADAARLPFRTDSFESALCLETIEHVTEPRSLGSEVMRVLRRGGVCVLTTPARVKFLLRADPHFGVKRLLAWPDRLQRKIVVEKLKLTSDYDVHHVFWTAGGVARNFPAPRRVKTLCNIPYPGIPTSLRQWAWHFMRWLLWDRILIFKR